MEVISTTESPQQTGRGVGKVLRDLRVLAKANALSMRSKAGRNFTESRLLSYTLIIFLIVYQFVAYFIFRFGLEYLYRVPGIGLMLIERVHHMLFFLFFGMLVCSNSILLYAGIFRVKETAWLLTLPLHHRSIFLWKVLESFLVSSWGVAILTAPMFVAFGTTFKAPWSFYPKAAAIYLPYLLLPATLSAMLVVTLILAWGRIAKGLLLVVTVGVAVVTFRGWLAATKILESRTPAGTSEAISEVLSTTSVATHPFVPSTWVSEQLYLWLRGYGGNSYFMAGLVITSSLMGLWLCAEVFSRGLFPCWVRSQKRKADATLSKEESAKSGPTAHETAFRKPFLEKLGVSRENAALIIKDVREFTRDPSQWIPFSVMYVLLLFYSLNLNRFNTEGTESFWTTLVSYMNFGVCSLVVSTLTTRFIFPLFSLEGRRLWILGLSPVSLVKVFWMKLLLYSVAIGSGSASLMLVSGTQLMLAWSNVFTFVAAILLLSVGMTSISLGLGVIFPNYQETNPAKIVSSYGGTLCLLVNFVYILLYLLAFVTPGLGRHFKLTPQIDQLFSLLDTLRLPIGMAITLLFAGTIIFLATGQIKRLEHLRKL